MPFSFLFVIYGFIGHTIGFTCDETANHCFTSIDIRSTYTMHDTNGVRVYAKNRQLYSHDGPVPTGDIISADGWNLTRKLITANGTMPGPPIIMFQHQYITIIVHNNLVKESVTIHWHGIDQLEHPAMDGVAYVTQCPILPGHFFNYTFKPRFGGTYWYHSHLGIQRDMGLYGAFIVIRKRDYFRKPSMNQHIIQIQEWNHQYDANELLNINPLPEPHSILINGRGQFKGILAPIETFNVKKGERYLFRLIGVGSHSTLLFSIPGLKLKVSETDGFEVMPIVVDKIIIFPAERYDFEVDLNNVNDKMYNITVSVLSSPNLTIGNTIGLGFLNVVNGYATSFVVSSNDNQLLVLNCPFQTYPNRKDFTCIPVSDLKSTTNLNNDAFSDEHIPKTNEKVLRFLNFAFPDGSSSVNGRIYHSPTVAPLTQPSETDTNCGKCGDEKTCECSYSLQLTSGSEFIMVLMTLGQGATISHPVHMHGHTFEVLKMVFPKVTHDGTFIFTEDIKCSETLTNIKSQCNNAKWKNDSWNDYNKIPSINLINPVRKDTIVVPYGGYVIIRIYARNPGVWFLHCHIDKHMVEGMAVMLNESFEHQTRHIPNGLPKCNSFLQSNSGVVTEVTDITTIKEKPVLQEETTTIMISSAPQLSIIPHGELVLGQSIVLECKVKSFHASTSWSYNNVQLTRCYSYKFCTNPASGNYIFTSDPTGIKVTFISLSPAELGITWICSTNGYSANYTVQEQAELSIIPHGELVLGQSIVLECKVKSFYGATSWNYNNEQLTLCFSNEICTTPASGNYKFTSDPTGIKVTIISLSPDELGITWICSTNGYSANYTVQEQDTHSNTENVFSSTTKMVLIIIGLFVCTGAVVVLIYLWYTSSEDTKKMVFACLMYCLLLLIAIKGYPGHLRRDGDEDNRPLNLDSEDDKGDTIPLNKRKDIVIGDEDTVIETNEL